MYGMYMYCTYVYVHCTYIPANNPCAPIDSLLIPLWIICRNVTIVVATFYYYFVVIYQLVYSPQWMLCYWPPRGLHWGRPLPQFPCPSPFYAPPGWTLLSLLAVYKPLPPPPLPPCSGPPGPFPYLFQDPVSPSDPLLCPPHPQDI